MPVWLRDTAAGCVISLHVQPGASKTAFAGEHDGALKIRLPAPPVDGKANTALLIFLAKSLGLRRADLTLIAGERARRKQVLVRGCGASDIEEDLRVESGP